MLLCLLLTSDVDPRPEPQSIAPEGGRASLAFVDLKTQRLETSTPPAAKVSVALTRSFAKARCGTLCDLMPLALCAELAGEVLPEAIWCWTTVVLVFAMVCRIDGGKLGVRCAEGCIATLDHGRSNKLSCGSWPPCSAAPEA